MYELERPTLEEQVNVNFVLKIMHTIILAETWIQRRNFNPFSVLNPYYQFPDLFFFSCRIL